MSDIQSYRSHFSGTIRLAIPVMIGQLGQVLMGVIDTMMIGGLGYEYVSASSLANSIFFIIIVTGIGITLAIAPLVAERAAKGDAAKCREILQQGTRIALIGGTILSCIVFFASPIIFTLDQPPRDAALAFSFLRVISFSAIPMLLFMSFKQFTDGLSDTVPAMLITLLGLGANVFFNYLLINGHWGFPALELVGAGIATFVARIIMAITMILWALNSSKYKLYDLKKGWNRLVGKTINKILKIGIPSGLQYFFEVGAFAGTAIMIGWMGSIYRSAHQITISIASVTFMIATGIAAASAIRVGDALGKHDISAIKRAGYSGLLLTLIFELFSALVFILGKDTLPHMFNIDNQEVLKITANLMVIGSLFQVFDGIQTTGLGVLRGIQDVNLPTFVTLVSYWVINLPLAYYLGFTLNMGVQGAWYSFVISLAIPAIAHTLRFWYLTRRKSKRWEVKHHKPHISES